MFRYAPIALLFACGKPADPITSLDGTKLIAQLADGEAKQYCTDLETWQGKQQSEDDARRIACAGMGLMATVGETDPKAACTKKYIACMAAPPKPKPAFSCLIAQVPKDCTVTIDQTNKCMTAIIGRMKKTAAKTVDELCPTVGPEIDDIMAQVGAGQLASCAPLEACNKPTKRIDTSKP